MFTQFTPEEIMKNTALINQPGNQPGNQPVNHPVNHPAHYTTGKIEVVDFIEDKNLNYHLGNVVKYVCRAGIKNKDTYIEDLQKAKWYIEREIRNAKNKSVK